MDSAGIGQRPAAGSSENRNESLGSTEGEKFLY
jgi:hypothetical protein